MRERRLKVTDDEIFAVAQRAMTRPGPHELTLAHIGVEAGMSPGRLVQRRLRARAGARQSGHIPRVGTRARHNLHVDGPV